MMVRTIFKVIAFDSVLLLALFSVLQDLQWRANYAASLHDACSRLCSYSPSFGYAPLIRFLTMSGNGVNLTSPPSLDWVQALVCAILVLNLWYAYTSLQSNKSKALTPA